MGQEQFLKGVHHYTRLISLYLNQKEDPEYEVSDGKFSFFLKLSKGHSLSAILYQTLKNVKVKISEDKLNQLEVYYVANVKKTTGFDKERKALYQDFNENGIDYLPLKGIILKDYYPDPSAREFADNDILFDDAKSDLMKSLFVKRGYDVVLFKKSNHDVYQKKPFFNFEMHRALFYEMEDNTQYVKYYQNVLEKAPLKEGYEHYLSNEDFYIYFTAHTYKHFRNSGCGIRTLIDYYLFLKKHELDFNYINQELTKIDLLDFSNKISSLSIKIFDNESLNQEEEEMLLYIASSGTYGSIEHAVKKGVAKKGKFRYLMSRLFPPMSFYKSAYPWAYKCRILIPIAWLHRFFRILFHSPKRAVAEIKIISKQKKDKTK